MRILLDECLPKQLRKHLPEHSVTTIGEAGWRGLQNGQLAGKAEGSFDVILTVDRRFAESAGSARRHVAVVILRAESNSLRSLRPLVPTLTEVLQQIKPGEVIVLGER